MNYRRFIHIIVEHGFCLDRQRVSHRVYKGVFGAEVRLVVVALHRESDEIKPGTLASMIRQSGLDKKLFR